MDTLETALLVLLMLDAVLLAVFVLMQQSRGADIGAAFGSGSANTLFGVAGATSFLAKLTTVLAIGFFLIAFGLAYVASERAMGLRSVDYNVVESEDSSSTPSDESSLDPGDGLPALESGEEHEGDALPEFEEEQDVPSQGQEIPDL